MKTAYYFGYGEGGHFLRDTRRWLSTIDPQRDLPGFPWSIGLLDCGLLKNGKIPDAYTGRVYWTCAKNLWLAFFWWDNSGDRRGNSNSGFYVQGFDLNERHAAFKFACDTYPAVVARQHHPLILQDR